MNNPPNNPPKDADQNQPQLTPEEQQRKNDAEAFSYEVYNNQMRIKLPSGTVLRQLELTYGDWFMLIEKYSTFDNDSRPQLLQCVHRLNNEGINWRHCPPLFAMIKFGKLQVVELIYYWRVRASMTGQYAGKDPARYSEKQITVNVGQKQVTGPEWCEIDIYRLVGGVRVRFSSGRIMFEKAVNAGTYWVQQPYDMLAKRAEASALRQAFPNGGEIDWETYQQTAAATFAMLGDTSPSFDNQVPAEEQAANIVAEEAVESLEPTVNNEGDPADNYQGDQGANYQGDPAANYDPADNQVVNSNPNMPTDAPDIGTF